MKRFYSKTLGTVVLSSALLLGASFNSEAQLVKFSFNGLPSTPNPDSAAADAQPANASVSYITRSAAVTPAGAFEAFSGSGWPFESGVTPPTLPNAPLDPAKYYTITLTPNANFQLDLDSISLSSARSGSGIRTFAVRSSLDNFTSDLSTFTVPDETNTFVHDLTTTLGANFNAIMGPVEFRFYGYNSESNGGTWRVDNIEFFGTVVSSGPDPVVSFSSSAVTVNESDATATVNVTISNPNAATATTVDVVVTGGTATTGSDYTYTTQTVTFPAGSSASQAVTFTIIDDTDIETDETIVVELQNQTAGVMVGTGSATITITDNDTPAPTIPLSTIASVHGENALGVATSLNQVVRLRGINHGVNLRPATATNPNAAIQWTIIDNTGGIGLFRSSGDLGYTYVEGDSIEVVGTISQFNGLTQVNVDSITVLTTGNPLFPAADVTVLDETTESRIIRLANPVMVVTPSQWTGTGSGFTVDVTDGINTYKMRIDNDVNLYGMTAPQGWFYLTGIGGQADFTTPELLEGYQILPRYAADLQYVPSLSFATMADSVAETAGSKTVTLNIMNPGTGATTVNLAVVGGTATAGTDFTYSTQTVTFAAGSTTPQSVTVTILDDTQVEGNETIEFAMQNASTGTIVGAGNMVLTILDNDPNAVAANVEKNSLSVYPNPASSTAVVSLAGVTGTAQVQLINSLGQLISVQTTVGAPALNLDLTNLATGVYTVRVVSEGAVKTGTLIKQ